MQSPFIFYLEYPFPMEPGPGARKFRVINHTRVCVYDIFLLGVDGRCFYKSKGLSQETPILLLKVLLDIHFKRIRQYLHPRRGYVYRSRVRQLHMGAVKFQNIFTIAENVN